MRQTFPLVSTSVRNKACMIKPAQNNKLNSFSSSDLGLLVSVLQHVYQEPTQEAQPTPEAGYGRGRSPLEKPVEELHGRQCPARYRLAPRICAVSSNERVGFRGSVESCRSP